MASADAELSEGSDIEVEEPNTDEECDEIESWENDRDENAVPNRRQNGHDFGNFARTVR